MSSKKLLIAAIVIAAVALLFVFFNSASAQSVESPSWYIPEQTTEVAVANVGTQVQFGLNPQDINIHVGRQFTESVKVTAANDNSMVQILFGFWYTPIPQANYVSASNDSCQLVALVTVPHYECVVGPLKAGTEVEFEFVMEAVEVGSAKTYLGVEVWQQDNPAIPPFFNSRSVDWNVEPIAVQVSAGHAIGSISDIYIEVPILINSGVTGLDLHSFIFTVTIDSNIVIPLYVRNGPLADQYGFETDNVLVDAYTFVVNGYSTQDLAGSGIFLWIGFQVIGTPGYTAVDLKDFTFGEGELEVIASGASITIDPPYVYGGAQYFYNGVPVPDVQLELKGNGLYTDTTDSDGYFEIKVPGGNVDWEFTATKEGDVCDAITPYDAYLINRCPLGLRSCNPASDVTNNGSVTPEDAAQVAMFSVGLPATEGVGLWSSNPVSYTLPSLSSSVEKHFIMSLGGDESGSWYMCHSASSATVQQIDVLSSVENNIVDLTISTESLIGALRLDLNLGEGAKLISSTSEEFRTFPNLATGIIGLYAKQDAVLVAHIRLEFQVDRDTEVKLPSLLINEDLYTSDLTIELPLDEMPPLLKPTFLPKIER